MSEITQAQIEQDQRSLAQRQHDALVVIGRIALMTDLGQLNGLPVSIIVRTTLQDLESRAGIGVSGGGTKIPIRDLTAREPRDDVVSDLRIRPVGIAGDLGGRQLRPAFGQIESAIAGEAGKYGVGKAEHRSAAARREILHSGEVHRWIGAHPSEKPPPGQVSGGSGRPLAA